MNNTQNYLLCGGVQYEQHAKVLLCGGVQYEQHAKVFTLWLNAI